MPSLPFVPCAKLSDWCSARSSGWKDPPVLPALSYPYVPYYYVEGRCRCRYPLNPSDVPFLSCSAWLDIEVDLDPPFLRLHPGPSATHPSYYSYSYSSFPILSSHPSLLFQFLFNCDCSNQIPALCSILFGSFVSSTLLVVSLRPSSLPAEPIPHAGHHPSTLTLTQSSQAQSSPAHPHPSRGKNTEQGLL